MHKLIVILLVGLIVLPGTASLAKSPKPGQRAVSPPVLPEDPQATAMRNARSMWPGRALCDAGGYRIVPCDIGQHF